MLTNVWVSTFFCGMTERLALYERNHSRKSGRPFSFENRRLFCHFKIRIRTSVLS